MYLIDRYEGKIRGIVAVAVCSECGRLLGYIPKGLTYSQFEDMALYHAEKFGGVCPTCGTPLIPDYARAEKGGDNARG